MKIKLTTCINACNRTSNQGRIANLTNGVLCKHSELIGFILGEPRNGKAKVDNVAEVGLYPSSVRFSSLHTVASDLTATIVGWSLPGQGDRVLGHLCNTHVCWWL